MIQWHIVDSATFKAGTKIDGDLYFLTDTKEIYRGEASYSDSVILYTTLPVEGIAKNRLYIDANTLEGKIHNGTEWKQVIKPLSDTVAADGVNPVSGKAVASYVAAELAKVNAAADIVSTISWDAAEHMLTATAKDGKTTQQITFDGLGVSLSYVAATGSLQLLDAAGNKIGDAISLPLEQFVTAGEYNAETKEIVLYFDEAKTNSVKIPVGALVDVYTGVDGSSVKVEVSGDNKITATVKVSAETGNCLVLKPDGIYVAAPDLADYMTKVDGAVEGNIAVFGTDGQVVDSGKTLTELASNSKIYQGASITEAVGAATPKKGDYCIVKKPITGDKFELTAYNYDGTNWVAFDGNYDAKNVYFSEDLDTTSPIGNITLTNGMGKVPAAGKNMVDTWNAIFVKEKNPSITQPAVSISKISSKIVEVGTTYTPEYSATLSTGKYEFGPETGITAASWEVSDTAGHTATTNAGKFDSFVVADDTSYTITCKANYEDGAVPLTNRKNPYAAGQIKAGSKSATSGAIRGYRAGFYGALKDKTGEINSALVRGLATKTNNAPASGNTWTITIPDGAVRVVFAYPASLRDVSSVLDVGGMNAEIKSAFTQHVIDVEGADGYTAKSYKVYVTDFAEPQVGSNTYTVKI